MPQTPVHCSVWLSPTSSLHAGHLALLSEFERQRVEPLRVPQDRDRSLAAAVLLRLAAGQLLAKDPAALLVDRTCTDCGEQHGAPQLVGEHCRVSVSHAGNWVAVALSTAAPVGVDIEAVGAPDLRGLQDLVVHPDDGQPADAAGFIGLWVRKEAVVKATGDGLRVSLAAVSIGGDGALRSYPDRPGLAGRVRDLVVPAGYAAAVAVLTDQPVLVDQRPTDLLATVPPQS